MNICFKNCYLELVINIWSFSGFIKFSFFQRNTENAMSDLPFNYPSDYSEENTCENEVFCSNILHHRKKLNIFTPHMPIYYIQY